ncbi:transcriptional attenuator, LytR family [Micromonospora rhizosphaerae]|uniref:Transcriptional attenuator, LytR family n=1 Tax=Micromonospora rhizosphaerae TaxID=568872 RepID=A0A1C6S441_9ACTN|nr:LCP family protein [Micromonospora rhizosphaerae]SCL24054.1 transcriptional attenuator, LytR family [Micromonospora rhizosphaerae]
MPRSRWARLTILVAALVLLLVIGGGGVGGWLYVRSLEKQVQKVEAFNGLQEAQRPVRAADSALNFLVVGKDQLEPGEATSRTDTIMLVHVPHSRNQAQVISIPRDTWTTIPESPPEVGGGPRMAKINAAYAWGGTPLLVRTVEEFTGVRIDHVVLVDFVGFAKVIDALGGVDVTVDRPFTSDAAGGQVYQPGVHRMNSAVALEYARERHQFIDGDYSRMRHQQAIVAAVMQEVRRRGILANPAQLDDFLRATAGAVQVDRELPLFDTIWSLRGLGVQDLTMLTTPTTGTGMVGDQSVIFPDTPASAKLFAAVRDDTMEQWLAENPTALHPN